MSLAEEPGNWWMRVSRGERGITFGLQSDSPITVTVTEDDLSRDERKRHRG